MPAKFRYGAVILLGALAMNSVRGDVSYKYVADQSSYPASGGTATAKIYLSETLSSGSASVISGDGGMDGAAFSVSLTSGSGATISGISFNPAFDAGPPINHSTFAGTSASLSESTNFGSPAVGFDGSGLGIYLGSLTFSASGSGTATFTVTRFDDLGGNTITRAGDDLDFNSTNPAYTGASSSSFTVGSAVPEPSTIGLMLAGSALLVRRRRP